MRVSMSVMVSATMRSRTWGSASVWSGRICRMRWTGRVAEVEMCTMRACVGNEARHCAMSWKQSCDLPAPAGPDTSTTPGQGRPPRRKRSMVGSPRGRRDASGSWDKWAAGWAVTPTSESEKFDFGAWRARCEARAVRRAWTWG
ncbi:hypothetical protein BCR44DRAFT_1424886 [Catenaria anguillulae PL171]|uniref:Uncharacterized protein n=1 Tax=Catenaria anguillulae PL171 TaxID=765915 RepID=A0A1Y2I303_9FUNG|nr:hypothetical protein BCR44DRAFT_1424886 [Catenaria anguillulae PL171]